MTFETALQIRRIAAAVPATAPVLETDSPDIPPHWLYRTAAEREAQSPPLPQARNEPAEVARIAAEPGGAARRDAGRARGADAGQRAGRHAQAGRHSEPRADPSRDSAFAG